jgi:hypothetical protein
LRFVEGVEIVEGVEMVQYGGGLRLLNEILLKAKLGNLDMW